MSSNGLSSLHVERMLLSVLVCGSASDLVWVVPERMVLRGNIDTLWGLHPDCPQRARHQPKRQHVGKFFDASNWRGLRRVASCAVLRFCAFALKVRGEVLWLSSDKYVGPALA